MTYPVDEHGRQTGDAILDAEETATREAVACPTCGACAGGPCRAPIGTSYITFTSVHVRRLEIFRGTIVRRGEA